jgi:hypothetical protein
MIVGLILAGVGTSYLHVELHASFGFLAAFGVYISWREDTSP